MGKKASIECALRCLDRNAEEEKAKCECMEMALADYEEAVGTFVERLTARRIERWQRIDLEVCPVPRTLNIKIGVDKEQMEFYPLEWKCLLN